MQFQFINGATIDADARKQIRSSVMLGRNAGKRRRREHSKPKPRILLPDLPATVAKTPPTNPTHTNTDDTSAAKPSLEIAIRERQSSEQELVRRREFERPPLYRPLGDDVAMMIYPRVVGYSTRKSILEFFHCLLALAQSHSDYLAGLSDDSPNTVRHLANSYRSINENLTREGMPSNATIASVMSIAMHHNILRASGSAKLHIDALERMVEMRGGVHIFASHRMLLQKLCRTDIEHSFQTGVRPRFYRDVFPHDVIRAAPLWSATSYEAFVTTTAAQIYSIDLQCIFRDILCASRYLNDTQGGPKIRPLDFQEILISVCYRLLHAHPLMDERPANFAEDACHLALLALMTRMLIRPDGYRARMSYTLVANLLGCAIGALGNGEQDDEFMLWLLFAGGISVLDPRRETWLAVRLAKCTVALGVDSWAAAREILMRFPWVQHFHDKPGEELWNSLDTTGLADQIHTIVIQA
ncbi:hypothetical protein ABW21_db0208221 [Orbilia brochopaga]|nr:hypothetical protein ABW21_db0208221 [Drechslerella brochopaga]